MASNLSYAPETVSASDTINIIHEGEVYAMVLPASFSRPGVSFFTPPEYSQQLAYISHPPRYVIDPHIHNLIHRRVDYTNEVLFIRKGKLRVDFYDENQNYLKSHILNEGDVILLIKGGHGFEVIEEVEMIEVKQGPYTAENDKTRFAGSPKILKLTKN